MSLHADAVDVLQRWSPPDRDQERLRVAYLAHLDAHPDAMFRECHPDHLTASTIILTRDLRHVLLTLHRKLRRWLQTGGHCEPADECLAGAATREGTEESGLDDLRVDPDPVLLSRHQVPCGPIRPAHHLDVQFVAYSDDGVRPRVSDESVDVRWFAADDLPASTDQSVRTLVQHARRR
ncbi:MAG TPA: NUDIX domain-containing protein [Nocardioidaceae bacterium]|nr:NUDIX domain-containing protein [Nocardioidaceae bacterium]